MGRKAVAITRFVGPYRFLSNFYRCDVEFEGRVYPSSENAYQAAKTLDHRQRAAFTYISPAEAKRRGRKLSIRPDWEAVKQSVMLAVLESKFSPSSPLSTRLLSTHPSPLVEGNTWGDTYWGVDLRTGEGENILGKLLVIVRENLRKGRGEELLRRREKRAAYFREWRARRAAELKEANRDKPLVPLPELPWAWSKRKGAREPLKRTETGRKKP